MKFAPQKNFKAVCCLFMLLSALLASQVHSHAMWDANGLTPPRTNQDSIKHPSNPQADDYCGVARTNNAVELESGSDVLVSWEARIYHRGYFKISLAERNDVNFNQHVLLDNYREVPGQRYYSSTISLPDIECEACTLQLIQVMEDRDPASFYYSCSDIRLSRSDILPPTDLMSPANVSDASVFAGDSFIDLSWQNPLSDFFRVMVLHQTAGFDTMPIDGIAYQVGDILGHEEVVYVGASSSFRVNDLANSVQHYFRIYAYDASLNYSPGVSLSAMPQASNVAPGISLVAEQNLQTTTLVDKQSGLVVVQANVTDGNLQDTHIFDWSATDSALVDLDVAASVFTFDPQDLVSGFYDLQVTVTDDGVPQLTAQQRLQIQVVEGNIAPVVQVQISQGATISALVKSNREDIRLSASIIDNNALDTHQIIWNQISGPDSLQDLDAGDDFVFSATNLTAGTYVMAVEVTDSGIPVLTTRYEVELEVRKPRAGSVSAVLILMLFLYCGFIARRPVALCV